MADTKPIVIAFTGYAGSGKDTVCTLLKNHLVGSVEIMRFADAIKILAQLLFPTMPPDAPFTQEGKEMLLPDSFMSLRELLQILGTEVMRAQDPDVWVKNLERRIEASTAKYILIPDLRFTNEADMIKRIGGKIVWIWREGVKVMNHASETEMITWVETVADVKIPSTTLEQLPNYARAVADFFELDWDSSSVFDRVITMALGDKVLQKTKLKVLQDMIKLLPLTKMELIKTKPKPENLDPPLVILPKLTVPSWVKGPEPIETMNFYEILAKKEAEIKARRATETPNDPNALDFYS